MRAIFPNRPQVQQVSGEVARAIDELVGSQNTQPMFIGTAAIRSGTGTPEGRVVGNIGDLYLRQDGSTSTTLYVKTSGTNTDTGWTGK
jgi:hypothetical protein